MRFNFTLCLFSKGLLSIFEAAHFAKPTISIPIFFDQNKNSKMVEHLGNGIRLSYEELTVTLLRNAIKKIFTDPRFALRMNNQIGLINVKIAVRIAVIENRLSSYHNDIGINSGRHLKLPFIG